MDFDINKIKLQIAGKLTDIHSYLLNNMDLGEIDVHLQFFNGCWKIWDGDSQYITDCRGFWSNSTVYPGMDINVCAECMLEDVLSEIEFYDE